MPNFCRYCGAPLDADSTFCNECGKPIAGKTPEMVRRPVRMDSFVCSKCNAPIKAGQKFCRQCGTRVRDEAGSVVGGMAFQETTADTYTPTTSTTNYAKSDPSASSGSISSFYLVDFLKNFAKAGNIPTIIYLAMNVGIVILITCSFFPDNLAVGIIVGLLAYVLSVCVALSPFGEWLLRYQLGCKPIQDQQVLNRMMPVFNQVYGRAKKMNPALPDNIKFYMSDDLCPNAFATGRKTVCVTKGLLQMTDSQIEGILGHEFGHLSHHDTDMLLLITVGNLFVNVLFFIIRIFVNIIIFISSLFVESFLGAITHSIASFCTTVCLSALMYLWGKLGEWLVMKSSRSNEYEADYFSAELGYRDALCDALFSLDGGGSKPEGIFAVLSSSHPATSDRISRLESY